MLRVILVTSLGTALVMGGTSLAGFLKVRQIAVRQSELLGDAAAGQSRSALESQTRGGLERLARDSAALADEKLLRVQNQTRMMADMVSRIYTHPERYLPRPILQPEEPGDFQTAPGVSPAAVRREAALAANAVDILRQSEVVDLAHSSISGESGYHITLGPGGQGGKKTPPDFDPRTRTWYRGARAAGGVFWTDVYADARGRGAAVTCAVPFYDLSGDEPVFKGVVACGFLLGENVGRILEAVKVGDSGYAFLLNDKGRLILPGEDFFPGPLAEEMLRQKSGVTEVEMEGLSRYVAWHPLATVPWILGVSVPIAEIIAPSRKIEDDILALSRTGSRLINRSIFFIIFCMLALTALISLAAIFIAGGLSKNLTAPIIALSDGARVIGDGNLDYRFDVKSGDELEALADSFNRMVGGIKEVTAEKRRINSDLNVAAEIQNDMLPKMLPPFTASRRFARYGRMEPAREVGGDFYDFFFLDETEDKLVLVIADVSGKGVPAALFMVIAKTLIKQQMLLFGDPARALEGANRVLSEENPRNMFVTVWIAALDLVTGEFFYANAGHNPPLLSAAGEAFRFMELREGLPLGTGSLGTGEYALCRLRLGRGDRLYLYTDGITEAMNPEGDLWGNERFLAAANRCRDLPLEKFDAALRREVRLFANGAEQYDDITTLSLIYTESAPPAGGDVSRETGRPYALVEDRV